MAGDNGQTNDLPDRMEAFQEAEEVLRDQGVDEFEEEPFFDTGEDDSASAPDEKQENEESESDEGDETDQSEEDSVPSGEDEPEESEEPEDTDGDEEGPVPYERFKEKVDEVNELEEKNDELEEQLTNFQNDYQYHLFTEEGQNELLEILDERGAPIQEYVQGESGEEPEQQSDATTERLESIQEQIQNLQGVLPSEATDVLEELSNVVSELGGPSADQAGDTDDQPLAEQKDQQERLNELQTTFSAMAEDDDYEHIEQLAQEPAEDDTDESWFDRVIADAGNQPEDNPYLHDDGIIKANMLDPLYKQALVESGILEEAAKEEGRDEAEEEIREKHKEDKEEQPMDPDTGTGNTKPTTHDQPNRKQAMEDAAKELGIEF